MDKQNLNITNSLLFKKWSRKTFASFASLNKIIKIGFLVFSYGFISQSIQAQEINDTSAITTKVDLDEVVVSASRSPKLHSEVARVITIIPKTHIQSGAVQSLQEILEYALNVDVRQRGVNGVQADVSIRGGSFDQTLFLLNGIPINDPQTGHHNLNLPVDLESIDRIEILSGPASRIFGPNAFSGAINIITNSESAKKINIALSGGQHYFYNGSATMQYSIGKTNHFIAFSTKGSQGYADNTDFKTYNAFYHGNYISNIGRLELQAGYMNKAFGANSFYTAKYPEQYEQVRNKFASLHYSNDFGKVNTKTGVYWRRNHDRFELFREDRYQFDNGYFITENQDTATYVPNVYADWNYYPNHNYHQTDILGANTKTSIRTKLGKTSIGLDFRYEHIYSNVLGLEMDTPIDAPEEVRGQFTKEAARKHFNAYLEHQYNINRFNITAGILGHYNNDYGFYTSSGGELSYRFGSKLKMFTTINQAMRMPTFTDLYYSGPSNIGNPDLKPEQAINYEVGLKGKYKMVNWHFSGFLRNTYNAIDWVKEPADEKYTTINHTSIQTRGFEYSGTINTKKKHAYSRLIDYISYSYCFIDVVKANDDNMISAYAMDYLKHKYSISAGHTLYKAIGFSWNFSFQDRNGTYTDENNVEQEYKPFALMDARLYWKKNSYLAYVEASNLFNTKYRDLGTVIQPGIWMKAGIKVNLNL